MTIRALALGGMTTLAMTVSAAAAVAPPAHFASPLSAQTVAQNWKYYSCQTDDGYGRHRPCDSLYKHKNHK